MGFEQTITLIDTLSTTASFQEATEEIVSYVNHFPADELVHHLNNTGAIPERFGHDSTQEKLFAKYCDALLARSLTELQIPSEVLLSRGDSADIHGGTDSYSIVGDAKAFRLTRTAINQKDFKIQSLHMWKNGANYALLVCPLYQYPSEQSQMYEQAIRCNVTLVSYSHLSYMILSQPHMSLEPLWNISQLIELSNKAEIYWSAVNKMVCKITNTDLAAFHQHIGEMYEYLPTIAAREMQYWKSQDQRILDMTHSEARTELRTLLKIDNRLAQLSAYTKGK